MPPTIKPFQIAVPDSKLQTLNQKLELATLPNELDGAGWDLGVPLADVKRLIGYWKDGFDWRAQEKALNEQMPEQFMAGGLEVEGFEPLDLHFVHRKSEVEGAVPLIFIHGCKFDRVLDHGYSSAFQMLNFIYRARKFR
jgi:hypothetical protein